MPLLELSPANTRAYDLIEPSDTGFTFVFFNALSGDKSMWTSTVGDALTAEGHGMLLYTLRGQAGSDTTATSIDCASIIEDAEALLDHVRPRRRDRADQYTEEAGPRLDWLNDAVVRAAEIAGFDLMKDL